MAFTRSWTGTSVHAGGGDSEVPVGRIEPLSTRTARHTWLAFTVAYSVSPSILQRGVRGMHVTRYVRWGLPPCSKQVRGGRLVWRWSRTFWKGRIGAGISEALRSTRQVDQELVTEDCGFH